jgi:hypothetical protein
MRRNKYQTVTSLPILVPDGSGEINEIVNFYPRDEEGSIPIHIVRDRDIRDRLRKIIDPSEIDLFLGIIELKQAHDAKDEQALERAYHRVYPWLQNVCRTRNANEAAAERKLHAAAFARAPEQIQWDFSQLVTSALGDARLVMWFSWKEQRFLPAVYCPTWRTAAFVKTFLGRVRSCPQCGKLFVPANNNVFYCKAAHRDAYRVARWRSRKKIAVGKQTIKKPRKEES